MNHLAEQHQLCAADPEAFWRQAGGLIDWSQGPAQACPDPATGGGWFPGGRLNTCHNTIDRHLLAGKGDRPAVVFESGISGASQTLSYAELATKVQECAAVLEELGVQADDRVLIFMPMIPDVIVGMLACARIGAIHSVVFGGFAAPELAARINDAEPTVLLTASCGLEPDHAFVVLKDGHGAETHAVARQIVDLVRAEFGAVAALREVHIVSALPKTRSGKLLRRTMRDLAEGRPAIVPGTIEDPSVVASLRDELESA